MPGKRLDGGRSGLPDCLVFAKKIRHLFGTPLPKAGRKRGAILNGLSSALRHVGKHGMTGISQESHSSLAPGAKRFAIEQGPLERRLDAVQNRVDLRMPAFIARMNLGDVSAILFAGPQRFFYSGSPAASACGGW